MLEKIYDHSPVWLQNLMCSVKGWQICRRRYSRQFYNELQAYEQGRYDKDVMLGLFLDEVKWVPAYVDIFNKYTNLKGMELLFKFPVLTKNEVKRHIADYINLRCKEPQITMKTSGTTGGGIVFPYTMRMENRQWAIWWRYRRRLGISLDTWCGWFGGKTIISLKHQVPPYWRINRFGKQVMYSSYHLNSQTIVCYYEDILRRGLKWLHGYPSSIAVLAELITEKNLKPIETVIWITTGAENLLVHHLEKIKKAFPNAMVRNHYGQSEGVANFSQDKEGNWHIDDDFAYVELIPVDEQDPSICKIIGTGFSNLAFPLIRYDTGDLARVSWKEGKPTIEEIYGRQDDYVELPNGVKLGRLDHIFKDLVNVKEAQIHQIRRDLIEVRVVKGPHYSNQDETLLLKEASSRFGSDVKIKLVYRDHIERTKSGKFKMVVSDIKN